MNRDTVRGRWKQLTGRAKQQWGKLTQNDVLLESGQRDQLAGEMQERRGRAKNAAEQLHAWGKGADESWLRATDDKTPR